MPNFREDNRVPTHARARVFLESVAQRRILITYQELSDETHATLDRISIVADNLAAATVKAKSLFDTLDMPQKPDGLRILDQVKRELFVWKPDDHDA